MSQAHRRLVDSERRTGLLLGTLWFVLAVGTLIYFMLENGAVLDKLTH